MLEKIHKPNHRLKSVKEKITVSMAREESGILSIANIKTGKCVNRREFLKGSCSLLVALGLINTLGGCEKNNEDKDPYNVSEFEKRFTFDPSGADCFSISPDGEKIATIRGLYSIAIWDISSQSIIQTLTGFNNYIEYIAFSSDGNKIGSVSHNGFIKIWDISNGNALLTISDPDYWGGIFPPLNGRIAFNPDCTKIAFTGRSGKLKIWDAIQRTLIMTIDNKNSYPVAFSPDGKKIASGGDDKKVKIWNVLDGTLLLNITASNSINQVQFNPDGTKIAGIEELGAEGENIIIWDATNGSHILTIKSYIKEINFWDMAWSPDGKKILVGGNVTDIDSCESPIAIYDTRDGSLLRKISNGAENWIYQVSWTPDGSSIVTRGYVLAFWSASTGDYLFHLKYTSLGTLAAEHCTGKLPWMKACTCDSVCTCDTVRYCTCDIQICTCDLVCTCQFT